MDAAGVALVLIGPGSVDQVYAVVACFWFLNDKCNERFLRNRLLQYLLVSRLPFIQQAASRFSF